jgi:hypothetical protein
MGWFSGLFNDEPEKSPLDKWLDTRPRDTVSLQLWRRYKHSEKAKKPFYSKQELMKDIKRLKSRKISEIPWL